MNIAITQSHLPGCSLNEHGDWINNTTGSSVDDAAFEAFAEMIADVVMERTRKSLASSSTALGIEAFNALPTGLIDAIGIVTMSQFIQLAFEQGLFDKERLGEMIAMYRSDSGPEDLLK